MAETVLRADAQMWLILLWMLVNASAFTQHDAKSFYVDLILVTSSKFQKA